MSTTLSVEQQRVVDLVTLFHKSVFFTGPAGTGKSFLLNVLRRHLQGGAGVFFTASTGLAACNIGGSTIHSWAGVGLGQGTAKELYSKMNKAAKQRWNAATTLSIDEISMIDGELFDKLEHLARLIRKNDLPFGGIQLILTGDFLQLPPINIQAKFAFQANSWSTCVPEVIQLITIYRQVDADMVTALNNLRRGFVDEETKRILLPCINRELGVLEGVIPTQLYCTRNDVQRENESSLAALPGDKKTYQMNTSGEPALVAQLLKHCAAPQKLDLKVGAQVVLVKNLDPEKGLVNGSRGVVAEFRGNNPIVRFCNGLEVAMVSQSFEIIKGYTVLASARQIPLMLAWALTIHKAQGMTLDRVTLDLSKAFSEGQAYVGFSRARKLAGLSVKGDIPWDKIKANADALKFYGLDKREREEEKVESNDKRQKLE